MNNAQVSLAWILHKYNHAVPIPGSKNQERILENQIPIKGYRGFEEFDGGSMANWEGRQVAEQMTASHK